MLIGVSFVRTIPVELAYTGTPTTEGYTYRYSSESRSSKTPAGKLVRAEDDTSNHLSMPMPAKSPLGSALRLL